VRGSYVANASSGKFILTLKPNRSYQMIVEAEGFSSKDFNLEFSEENGYINIPKEILLQPK